MALDLITSVLIGIFLGVIGGGLHWVVPEVPSPDFKTLIRRISAGAIVGLLTFPVIRLDNPWVIAASFGAVVTAGYAGIDWLKNLLKLARQ